MRVVLFNGPRGVGKSEIASQLHDRLAPSHQITILSMIEPMKLDAIRTVRYPGFTDQFDGNLDEAYMHFEANKDTPLACLEGKTPRQFYIDYGNALRERHGQNVLAELWLKRAAQLDHRGWLLVPDVRFQHEVNAAVKLAGRDHTMLVYVVRDTASWKHDIGSYCEHDWSCTFFNNGTLDDLGGRVERLLERAWS